MLKMCFYVLFTDVNECERFPCGNGAQCINTVGSYYCVCPVGFQGPDCRVGKSYLPFCYFIHTLILALAVKT